MELIEFKPGIRHGNKGFHGLTVNGNYYNATVSVSLSVTLQGKSISILKDKNRPEDWYLKVAEDGYTLSKKGSGCHTISGQAAFKELYHTLKLEAGTSYRFLVAKEPVEHNGNQYYAIITKSAQGL